MVNHERWKKIAKIMGKDVYLSLPPWPLVVCIEEDAMYLREATKEEAFEIIKKLNEDCNRCYAIYHNKGYSCQPAIQSGGQSSLDSL